MKVYVAMGHYDYEDSYLLGVFDSKEKAQKCCEEEEKEEEYDCTWVDEREVL